LIALYFLGGLLGRLGAFQQGDLALVWPPAGIALAALLLFGYRFLPGVFLGAVLFSMMDGKPIGFFTFATAIGNCTGALVSTYLLYRNDRFERSFERLKDSSSFAVLACLFGTTVNALFNVAGLALAGKLNEDQSWERLGGEFLLWWMPNVMGCLLIAPVLLSFSNFQFKRWSLARWGEASACTLALLISTGVAFESWYVYGVDRYPFAYLPFPFVVWASARFGVRGGTLATLLVSMAAVHSSLEQRGPFVSVNETQMLLLMGSYFGVLGVTSLFLGASSTERRKAMEEVSASRRRYRAVVEDQAESICRFDLLGRLTFVNEAFCRLHKTPAALLLGTSFLPQITAEDMEIPLRRLLELTPESPSISYDARIVQGDGSPGWEHCTVRAVFDEKGQMAEFQMVSQNITARKLAEEALRTSEERIKAIIVDGIITLDRSGRIISTNPAAERIFGYNDKELVGREFDTLLYAEDVGLYHSYMEILKSESTADLEFRGRRRDGTTFTLNVAISELIMARQTGFIIVARDMTKNREAEEQLRHAQKMQTIGHLAGGVAHDFNNLLSIIIGHAGLLKEKHLLPEAPMHSVNQIRRSAERGAKLTRQLLMFSRKEVTCKRRLELNETLLEMQKMLDRVVGENIALRYAPASEPLYVHADESMLDQVLVNLVVNARDAVGPKGALTIATGLRNFRRDELKGHEDCTPGDYAMFSVTDNGCGIPPEVLPRIFEPFFTTKDVGKGTGLGLSIVYGVIHQHKGFVVVRSKVNEGTTFECWIPLQPADAALPPSADSARQQAAMRAQRLSEISATLTV
jgi:PAS domain S-box-containing protein